MEAGDAINIDAEPNALNNPPPQRMLPEYLTGKFGNYQIEEKIGQGGMGVVYLATDLALSRKVALKILLPQDEESLKRFIGEAQAAARLKHPNITQIYEVGIVDGYHYLTMDLISGSALADFSRAIEIDPDDGSLYYNRGIVYYLKSQFDKAITDFTRAIELTAIKTDLATTYDYRGRCYARIKDFDMAIADYRKAIG